MDNSIDEVTAGDTTDETVIDAITSKTTPNEHASEVTNDDVYLTDSSEEIKDVSENGANSKLDEEDAATVNATESELNDESKYEDRKNGDHHDSTEVVNETRTEANSELQDSDVTVVITASESDLNDESKYEDRKNEDRHHIDITEVVNETRAEVEANNDLDEDDDSNSSESELSDESEDDYRKNEVLINNTEVVNKTRAEAEANNDLDEDDDSNASESEPSYESEDDSITEDEISQKSDDEFLDDKKNELASDTKQNKVGMNKKLTYLTMIVNGLKLLENFGRSRKGTSLVAIKKFILMTYNIDLQSPTSLASFRRAINKALTRNMIIQITGRGFSGSYRLVNSKPKKSRASKVQEKMVAKFEPSRSTYRSNSIQNTKGKRKSFIVEPSKTITAPSKPVTREAKSKVVNVEPSRSTAHSNTIPNTKRKRKSFIVKPSKTITKVKSMAVKVEALKSRAPSKPVTQKAKSKVVNLEPSRSSALSNTIPNTKRKRKSFVVEPSKTITKVKSNSVKKEEPLKSTAPSKPVTREAKSKVVNVEPSRSTAHSITIPNTKGKLKSVIVEPSKPIAQTKVKSKAVKKQEEPLKSTAPSKPVTRNQAKSNVANVESATSRNVAQISTSKSSGAPIIRAPSARIAEAIAKSKEQKIEETKPHQSSSKNNKPTQSKK